MTLSARAIDSLQLHPDSERVPMATAGDLATLRASLEENGQQDPIDVTPDGLILDGRTRWTLLRDIGARSVQVREIDIPDRDQTHYIVDRALARRHLTAEQKRALNGLLREAIVEVAPHPITGEDVRIGKGPTERAAMLGVDRATVNRWDETEPAVSNAAPAPTHYRRSNRQIQPLHPNRAPKAERATPTQNRSTRVAPKPKRTGPPWHRHFTVWCRAVLPEDRKYLMAMSEELHKSLALLGLSCETGGDQ